MAKKAPRGVSKPDREAKPDSPISEKLLCKGKKIFFDGKCRGRKFLKKLMAPGVDQSKGGFQGARYNQIRKKDSVLVVIESLDDGYRSVIVEAKAGGKSSKSTQRNGYRVGMEVSTVYDWVNIAGPDRSGDYPRKTRSWSTPSKNGKRLKVRHWEQTIFSERDRTRWSTLTVCGPSQWRRGVVVAIAVSATRGIGVPRWRITSGNSRWGRV